MPGLLLRHAVHGAESPDQVAGIDRDDFAPGERVASVFRAMRSLGSLKTGTEHDAVRDVEIGVAGGQASALEDDRPGHGKFDDGERLAVLIAGGLQAAEVVRAAAVIHISRIGLDHGDDRVCETKRVRSSTWPWVSSPKMPRPSQIACWCAEVVGEELLVVFAGHGADCAAGLC